MPDVFLLQHVSTVDDREDVKVLGIYSSPEEAQKAVERFKVLPGFSSFPDAFSVDRYSMNSDSWASGFTRLTQILVPLQDEGTTVWRPVWASHVSETIFRIESENLDPDDERWLFVTGQFVRVESKTFDGRPELVAVEPADTAV